MSGRRVSARVPPTIAPAHEIDGTRCNFCDGKAPLYTMSRTREVGGGLLVLICRDCIGDAGRAALKETTHGT